MTGRGCVEYRLKEGTDRDRNQIIQLREDGVLTLDVSFRSLTVHGHWIYPEDYLIEKVSFEKNNVKNDSKFALRN